MTHIFFKRIAQRKKGLQLKLNQAGLSDPPEIFVKKTFVTASYMAFGLFAIVMGFAGQSSPETKAMIGKFMFFVMPVFIFVLFQYFSRIPDVKIIKREKSVSKEIVFAIRFLIIELSSGVPLYESMNNISSIYPEIGKLFKEIIIRVDFGTPIADAINESMEITPNDDFRKILWQISSSLRTGANISESLESVLAQITRKQVIEINKYGKKLNPLAMFYMMLAVILPSIGITMLIVLSTFISIELNLTFLLAIAGALSFMQFMFLALIKTSRPAVEL